jgi:hypothetical protein
MGEIVDDGCSIFIFFLFEVYKADGTNFDFEVDHSLNEDQIKWFSTGSALNHMRNTS